MNDDDTLAALNRIASRVHAGASMPLLLSDVQQQYVAERVEMIRAGARQPCGKRFSRLCCGCKNSAARYSRRKYANDR